MTITEKIKQIIAKANSTTSEAEADALMAMAARLMEKHQIEAHMLGDNDPLGTTEGDFRPKSGPSSYRPRVLAALAQYYGCKVFWYQEYQGKHIKQLLEISGPESARITTSLMMDFVWQQIVDKAAKLAEEGGHGDRGKMLRHICNAMCGRLYTLTAVDKQSSEARPRTEAVANALMVIGNSLTQYYAEKYPNRVTLKAGTRKALNSASKAAAGISLARQTTGTAHKRIG